MVNDFKLQDPLWLGWNTECTTVGNKWIWGLMHYLRRKVVVHILDVVVVHQCRLNVAISSNFFVESWEYKYLCEIIFVCHQIKKKKNKNMFTSGV